jgi:hypothetical protein
MGDDGARDLAEIPPSLWRGLAKFGEMLSAD